MNALSTGGGGRSSRGTSGGRMPKYSLAGGVYAVPVIRYVLACHSLCIYLSLTMHALSTANGDDWQSEYFYES